MMNNAAVLRFAERFAARVAVIAGGRRHRRAEAALGNWPTESLLGRPKSQEPDL